MRNNNKRLGSGLEDRVVERASKAGLEARKQPGSGVYKEYPSDAVVENILVECKVRSSSLDAKGNTNIHINLDWLRKAQKEASEAGFEGAVVVVNPKGSTRPLALVDLNFLIQLLVEVRLKSGGGLVET
jgi:hypothetical protein